MALRGSVSSSLAQTGSFGRMQGRRLATQFLNVQSGSFGRVIATNFVGDGSQLTNVSSPFTAAGISGSILGATTATASFGQMILNDAKSIKIQHPTENTSVFIGHDAGVDDDGANNNIAIGTDSMGEITSGQHNIALGHDSLHTETTGDYNVALGYSAMANSSDADDTIAIGRLAGKNLRPGSDYNIFMGHDSGENFAVGDANIAIGNSSMKNTDSGSKNIAIGSSTLDAGENSSHDFNVAIGDSSLSGANGVTYGNIAIGYRAAFTAGSDGGRIQYCIALGWEALRNAQKGQYPSAGPDSNIAIGYQAMKDHVTGSYNIAIGRTAMRDIGNSTQNQNDSNIGIGHAALQSLENGDSNVAIGRSAMSSAGSDGLNSVGGNVSIGGNAAQFFQKGGSNVFIGSDVAQQYATGSNNVILGRRSANNASRTNATGDMGVYNFIQGYFSGQDLDGGSYNVLLGYQAGNDLTTGGTVTAIGTQAGDLQTTGGSGTYIGYNTRGTAGAAAETVIGANAIGKGANTVTIGDDNVTDIYLSEDKGAIVYAGIFSGSATGLTDIPASLPTFTDIILQTEVGGSDNTIIGDTNTFSASNHPGLTTSRRNVIIGADAAKFLTTGDQNTVVGNEAMLGSAPNGPGSSNVAIGYYTLRNNLSGNNVAVGASAGRNTTTGGDNTFIGNGAGISNTSGSGNTYVGSAAGQQMNSPNSTLGKNNTMIGNGAGQIGRHAVEHVAIGYSAARSSKQLGSVSIGSNTHVNVHSGSYNVAIGNNASQYAHMGTSHNDFKGNVAIGMSAQTPRKGNYNVGLGESTFGNYLTGSNNFAVGFRAGYNNAGPAIRDFGNDNIALGGYAMSADGGHHFNGGDYNFFVGVQAGAAATNCDYTIAIGYKAGRSIGDGSDRNIFLGTEVARNFKDGDYNIAIGTAAMYSADSGSENIAIGSNALQGSEGVGADIFTKNIAIGHDSLKDMKSGAGNVSIGGHAMENAGDDANHLDDNVAIGRYSINALEKGDFNIALGYYSMRLMQSGSNNIAIGNLAMGDNANSGVQVADDNVAIGFNALGNIIDGSGNIGIGKSAGSTIEDGSNNIYVGIATVSGVDVTDEIVIAAGSGAVTGAGTETIRIGVDSDHITNDFGENATWTHSSDKRIKKDIEDNTLGLEFINKLKTRTFKKKAPSEYPTEFDGYDAEVTERKNPNRKHYGFVAQEVKKVMDSVGHSEFPVWKENSDGMQELGETELITPLIKAVQELTKKVEEQQKEIDKLRNQNG